MKRVFHCHHIKTPVEFKYPRSHLERYLDFVSQNAGLAIKQFRFENAEISIANTMATTTTR